MQERLFPPLLMGIFLSLSFNVSGVASSFSLYSLMHVVSIYGPDSLNSLLITF